MQHANVTVHDTSYEVTVPGPDNEVMPGVWWGLVEAFPTPAYWAFQVMARRLEGNTINYKLGSSLKEEVVACILGGHGMPSYMGVAAFKRLKEEGILEEKNVSKEKITNRLETPMMINNRAIRYRFSKQKAKYIYAALNYIENKSPPSSSGRSLRDWLLNIPGIGYKTASWISRNWLDADDVAILDIHILRAGVLGGFFDRTMSIAKHYLALEARFLDVCKGMNVKASELDAVIWYEMMRSPRVVHKAMSINNESNSFTSPNQRHPHPNQTPLLLKLANNRFASNPQRTEIKS